MRHYETFEREQTYSGGEAKKKIGVGVCRQDMYTQFTIQTNKHGDWTYLKKTLLLLSPDHVSSKSSSKRF